MMDNRKIAKELNRIAKTLASNNVANKSGEYKNFTGTIDWKGSKGEVSNATFELMNRDGIIWYDGTWKRGRWYEGTWKRGVWKDGTWEYGIWKDGTWKNGTWERGWWYDGTWKDGTWKNGVWKDGTWEDGLWKKGTWEYGIWVDGTWKEGKDKMGRIRFDSPDNW